MGDNEFRFASAACRLRQVIAAHYSRYFSVLDEMAKIGVHGMYAGTLLSIICAPVDISILWDGARGEASLWIFGNGTRSGHLRITAKESDFMPGGFLHDLFNPLMSGGGGGGGDEGGLPRFKTEIKNAISRTVLFANFDGNAQFSEALDSAGFRCLLLQEMLSLTRAAILEEERENGLEAATEILFCASKGVALCASLCAFEIRKAEHDREAHKRYAHFVELYKGNPNARHGPSFNLYKQEFLALDKSLAMKTEKKALSILRDFLC